MKTKTISKATMKALQMGELVDGVFRLKTWIGDAGFRELRELFAPCSGKWSSKHRGFVFSRCPKELIAQAVESGRYEQSRDSGNQIELVEAARRVALNCRRFDSLLDEFAVSDADMEALCDAIAKATGT